MAAPFIYKSVSEETRSTYRRAVSQFLTFVGNIHPSQVTTAAVLAYRDCLITQGRLRRGGARIISHQPGMR